MAKVINVEIGSYNYKLQSENQPRTLRAAEVINEYRKMVSTGHEENLPYQKVIDIANLNLAEELLSIENSHNSKTEEIAQKLTELCNYLENVLTTKTQNLRETDD